MVELIFVGGVYKHPKLKEEENDPEFYSEGPHMGPLDGEIWDLNLQYFMGCELRSLIPQVEVPCEAPS